ncbi:MAG: TIM barrel protein [Alphaproteobacteria bacterium]|nr:TIM barrel protein [Alphaproteobacteria bacterium]
MPRFAANLSYLYQEFAFLDRFAAAAEDGFKAVEFLFPYDFAAESIAAAARRAGMNVVLFNLPPGDLAKGERGLAALKGREREFADALERGFDYAGIIDCPRLHAMAGRIVDGAEHSTYVANLRMATAKALESRRAITIEPLNTRDNPGYFLTRQQAAHDICADIGSAALGVQMDIYHCQIEEGDVTRRIERHIASVGHIQIAGVPDRHEPDEGELSYPYLFDLVDRVGYAGWIGCEYRPRAGTREGLGWARQYLRS